MCFCRWDFCFGRLLIFKVVGRSRVLFRFVFISLVIFIICGFRRRFIGFFGLGCFLRGILVFNI